MCGYCQAKERHRLLWLVLSALQHKVNFRTLKVLHFAPEVCLSSKLRNLSGEYRTADLDAPGVDHHVDICDLPFGAGQFDLVLACHVLEHVREDQRALGEIRRVLSTNGMAILPVPIVSGMTVEYPAPNPHEHMHVRAPGLDYYDRYKTMFSRVDLSRSGDFDDEFQTWTYEDRSRWPTKALPLRGPMFGARHEDFIPVCYV